MMTIHDDNATDPNLAVPPGATAGGWDSIDNNGVLIRSLEWSHHDTEKVGVTVDGWQGANGTTTRGVSIYGADGETLTAIEARQLAAALAEAADAMEALQ